MIKEAVSIEAMRNLEDSHKGRIFGLEAPYYKNKTTPNKATQKLIDKSKKSLSFIQKRMAHRNDVGPSLKRLAKALFMRK